MVVGFHATALQDEDEEDSLAGPLAAAIGAPLLGPIADAFRRCGEARMEFAAELTKGAVGPLARMPIRSPTPTVCGQWRVAGS